MKKNLLFIFSIFPAYIYAQTLTTATITNWETLRKSGFYESSVSNTSNLPSNNLSWYWGINIAHSVNSGAATADKPYYYGGQILFGINAFDTGLPLMFIRSTNNNGKGAWAKVLTDNGPQAVRGELSGNTLSSNSLSDNTLKTVLARLQEGNSEGEGTYLGVKSYYTQSTNGIPLDKVKSFSIEHKFYGRINNSIDFYRGGGMTSGYIGITVYDGRQIGKFHSGGLDIAGTVRAKEVKVEINAGADHVFNPDYDLKPLSEVEEFIRENKHLPEVPSEQQMQTQGLNMNEFQIKLLQKIEELTLYVIQQEKKNLELEQKLETLQTALSEKQ